MIITGPRMHHLAITVRDLEASADWYGKVFGVKHHTDVPHEGGIGKGMVNPDTGLVLVLHRHDRNSGETFDETRTGLDHLGLSLPSRDDLVAWQAFLETHGVLRAEAADRPLTQSPIADESYGAVLVFRDPDNIQLELFVPSF